MKNLSNTDSCKYVGVVGAGSFGTAIANLLSTGERQVLLYTRDAGKLNAINQTRISAGQKLSGSVIVTDKLEEIGRKCEVIFPMIPSAGFREVIRTLSHFLKPYHILIHGTKGFDINIDRHIPVEEWPSLTRSHVRTMSEVILEETSVLRIGCLAGPNLSNEIAEHKPAATVIASRFEEVILLGYRLLKNERFLVYGSKNLLATEFCGILKNIIALGAGTIESLNLGENAKALFISRGLFEMIHIGKAFGVKPEAFFGLAGIGDLIATCNSHQSRNFITGFRLAKGERIEDIIASMDETAEGVRTIDIVRQLAQTYKIKVPITNILHRIIQREISITEAHKYFMKLPLRTEISF